MAKKQQPTEKPAPPSTDKRAKSRRAPKTKNATSKKSSGKGKKEASFKLDPLVLRALVALLILIALYLITQPGVLDKGAEMIGIDAPDPITYSGIRDGNAPLSDVFTPEVMYWQEPIKQWAQQYHINPNMLATIVQIESCGDPYVSSHVGAQGLFQVMPFNFEPGENQLHPDVNARAGIEHLLLCLRHANNDPGMSFACYNAGFVIFNIARDQWVNQGYSETDYYYRWGSGIYNDAISGFETSRTLQEWLNTGGSSLCDRAQATQNMFHDLADIVASEQN